jgi:formate hydrogenlyase subunit 3/multisubunit Na+/H+ antiporter MnhD subunit
MWTELPGLFLLLPFAGTGLVFLLPNQTRPYGGLSAAILLFLVPWAIAADVYSNSPIDMNLGGWPQPLGIGIYIDGLSVLFLLLTAVVGLLVSVYAWSYFSLPENKTKEPHFWPLWLILWGGLNALFSTADIFNTYVLLELVGISAAALTALAGNLLSLTAALRYFLVAVAGSLAFLLGVGFIYAQTGQLDMYTVAQSAPDTSLMAAAFGLISVGLMSKTALFPFHFWLPPAHGNAPAPISAALSALVIKGSFFVLLKFWFVVFHGLSGPEQTGWILGILALAATLWGSYQALIQSRLKLIIAYSSVGQLGYMFLIFPLLSGVLDPGWKLQAWAGCGYQVLSHGLAKAALFLAAGNLIQASGTDNIHQLRNIAVCLPMTSFTMGLAGVSLMGLPPSGGFMAKWLLLQAILASGQWWLALVPVLGGLLTAGYIFRLLSHTFVSDTQAACYGRVFWGMDKAALFLALSSILIGFRAQEVVFFLQERTPILALGGGGP